jgi:hypothetical protein
MGRLRPLPGLLACNCERGAPWLTLAMQIHCGVANVYDVLKYYNKTIF